MTKSVEPIGPYDLAVDPSVVPGMISGGNRNGLMGTGDMRPRAMRPGALDADAYPSRVCGMLCYRDGRRVPVGDGHAK